MAVVGVQHLAIPWDISPQGQDAIMTVRAAVQHKEGAASLFRYAMRLQLEHGQLHRWHFEMMADGGEKTQKQVQFLCPKMNHLSVDGVRHERRALPRAASEDIATWVLST